MQYEYSFTLPKGYRDQEGNLHRKGVMRLATARDEIEAMRTSAKQGSDYVTIYLLSSVIISLGTMNDVVPDMVENMYTADINFLQNMYQTINQNEDIHMRIICPHCGKEFEEAINFTQQE